VLSSGTTDALFDNTITLSQTAHFLLIDTGAHGSQLATHEPAYSLSPAWDVFPFTYPEPDYPDKETRWADSITDGDRVISAQEQDILIETANASAHRYSLNGSTFHDFQVWNPSSKQLKSTAVGKTSDDLVMLLGDSDILINQTKRSVSDLVNDADGWSNFELEDINSHGMIVGTAEKGGATKVIALLKVEFETFPDDVSGPDKAHKINLSTRQNEAAFYGEYEKSVSHIWESSQTVNLIDYLADSDVPSMREVFEQALEWRSNGEALSDHELNYGSNPGSDDIERFNIEVPAKGSSTVIDRLIVVVVPPETLEQFNTWYAAETDMGWLSELPALYWRFQFEQEGTINPVLVPVDPEPSSCAEQRWGDFGESDTYYHPDGYYKARSEKTQNGHGHQAIYTLSAIAIKSGVSAGSADRQAPFPSNLNPFLHVNADVKPFIWAAQLDGNPVEESGTTMTAPMLHEGANLSRYFERRPAIANGLDDLSPGECSQ